MFVLLNSVYVLMTMILLVVSFLDEKYNDDIPGPVVRFMDSENVAKNFFWGVCEQTSTYVLFYILPILLAIKFRNSRNFVTMAGTIFGVINLLVLLVHNISFGIFA